MVTAPVIVYESKEIKPSFEDLKKQLVAQIDVNHDGSITKEELKKFFLRKGIHGAGLRTHLAFWRFDNDKSGKLDDQKELDSLVDAMIKNWGANLICK